jgi:hypothetical protein
MIRTEAAASITEDICYVQKIAAHNKYLPQFFVCNNNNLIYHHRHISLLLSIVVALLCVEGYNVYT